MLVAERVNGLQDEGGDQRAEERPPERLQRKVVAHFFEAENGINSSYGLKPKFFAKSVRFIQR